MKNLLRIVCALLALATAVLVAARVVAIGDFDEVTIMELMKLVFPFSISLFFGYMALTGRMPFTPPPDNGAPDSRPPDSP